MNSYTLHITLYDLFFFAMVIVGVTFALLLAFTKSINRGANRILALALVTMILWMVRVLAIDINLGTYLPGWNRLPMQFLPALGPFMYFYVLKITCPQYKYRWKDLLHFSPVLLELAALALEIKESIKTGTATYATQTFQQLNPVLELVVFISVIAYLYKSRKLIQNFYSRLQPVLMDRSRLEFRWLRRLLAATALLWFLWLVCAAVNYFGYHNLLGVQAYYPFYILFSVIIIWTAAAAFLKPQAGAIAKATIPVKPPIPAEMRAKGAWIKRAMEANRYYQDPEISLSSLAEKLNLPPHELSRIINTGLKKSFYDFINQFRVNDAARKMQDPAYDNITLLGIAYEAGFNSKRTFNRVFKETAGKTPKEYKDSLKKEGPMDKLAPRQRMEPLILRQGSPPVWAFDKLKRSNMIRNYLKIAWRNIIGSKVYSALNIAGLSIGMALALLIGLWAFDQYSYDRFLPGYEQAYSVKVNFTGSQDGTHTQNYLPVPLADVLRGTIPGIKYVAEADIIDFQSEGFVAGNKKMLVSGAAVAPDFLKIFKFPIVKGDLNSILKDPFSIVIDESTAKALYSDNDPVGKVIRIDNQHDVKVTGVVKNFPSNSTFQFHFVVPYAFAEQTQDWIKNARNDWGNNSFEIFVGLQPGVTEAQVASKVKNLIVQNYPSSQSYKPEVFLYPLKSWHLYSEFKDGKAAGGFISYVRMFSVIGVLVLLIACVNFINLSTARSQRRAREVGVRKAIGSSRSELIYQFLTEAVLLTAAAFLLSITFLQLALPYFNSITASSLQIPYTNPVFWCMMAGYVLVTGLLAGARPAFYLSAFNPVTVLKGKIATGKAASLPRKILVVVQFTCSVAFIISTVIIYQQIQYVKNRPTGYSADRLVSTIMTKDLSDHYDAFKTGLMATHMVEDVTKASSPVTSIGWHTTIDQWPGQNAGDPQISVGAIIIDDNYFNTVGMQLAEGHNFSGNVNADGNNIIVNESALKRMGLKNPVNQLITFAGTTGPSKIIGVVKDALMESPFATVQPLVFVHRPSASQVIYRLSPRINPHEALEKIGKVFDKYNPAYPFSYSFVDEAYEQKFKLETLVGKLAGIFAALAIFISCLGLFGLAAYVAEQRTKEIGIRKVLGASVGRVWILLSGGFVVLVIISCLVASPIALYFLNNWLQKYEYRISIGPGVFILSAVTAIVITLITVSFQSVKAAIARPVKSLRSE